MAARLYVEEITPQKAAEYLRKNLNNRQLNGEKVQNIKKLIDQKKWNYKKGRLDFSSDGTLLNGQHRLKAIELAGKVVPVRIAIH